MAAGEREASAATAVVASRASPFSLLSSFRPVHNSGTTTVLDCTGSGAAKTGSPGGKAEGERANEKMLGAAKLNGVEGEGGETEAYARQMEKEVDVWQQEQQQRYRDVQVSSASGSHDAAATAPAPVVSSSSSNSSGNPAAPAQSHYFWISDRNAKSCYECESAFTMLLRRHHCRVRLPPPFASAHASGRYSYTTLLLLLLLLLLPLQFIHTYIHP